MASAYAAAWRDRLGRPAGEEALLEDPGERARRLRQASPFAGLLDARTRWTIWREAGRGDRRLLNRSQLEHSIRAVPAADFA